MRLVPSVVVTHEINGQVVGDIARPWLPTA